MRSGIIVAPVEAAFSVGAVGHTPAVRSLMFSSGDDALIIYEKRRPFVADIYLMGNCYRYYVTSKATSAGVNVRSLCGLIVIGWFASCYPMGYWRSIALPPAICVTLLSENPSRLAALLTARFSSITTPSKW